MTQPYDAAKICHRCSKDVSLQPRMKDKAGRFYCKPCAETLKTEAEAAAGRQQSRQVVSPPPMPVETPSPNAAPGGESAAPWVIVSLIGTLLVGGCLLIEFTLPNLRYGDYRTPLIGVLIFGVLMLAAGMIKLLKHTGDTASPGKPARLGVALCGGLLGLFLIAGVVMVKVYKTTATVPPNSQPNALLPRWQPSPQMARLAPITMKNPSLLETGYHAEPNMGFRMRLPRAWMIDPTVAASSTGSSIHFGVKNALGTAAIFVTLELRDDDFDTFVSHGNDYLQQENYRILEDGVATIGSRQVRVIRDRSPLASLTDFESRSIYIDGPDNAVFTIQCQCSSQNWDRCSALFDSAVSTFEIGQ